MTDQIEENTEVAVTRDANLVITELKTKVGRLGRQEIRAVESDKMASTFNAEIMEMATGAKPQTPDNSIATISAEQAKHIKRAAKVRETNKELAGEIRDLEVELKDFLETLLTPYPVAVDETEGTEGEDNVEESDED